MLNWSDRLMSYGSCERTLDFIQESLLIYIFCQSYLLDRLLIDSNICSHHRSLVLFQYFMHSFIYHCFQSHIPICIFPRPHLLASHANWHSLKFLSFTHVVMETYYSSSKTWPERTWDPCLRPLSNDTGEVPSPSIKGIITLSEMVTRTSWPPLCKSLPSAKKRDAKPLP